MAWLLTGLMSFESIFGSVMPVAAAGEDEDVSAGLVTEEAAEETTEDVDVEDEGFVRITPNEDSGRKIDSLIGNLGQYMPEGDGINLDYAQMPVTGISHIMPSEGDVNTLVFLAEFTDCKFKEGFEDDFTSQIFKPDSADSENDPMYPLESLNAYYQRASFGKLSISGDCICVDLDHERSYYNDDQNLNIPLYQAILNEWAYGIVAKKPADSTLTDLEYLDSCLAKYDLNNDMQIDGCYFVFAGGHNGWSNQWWAYRIQPYNISVGSYKLPAVVQVVDTMHEMTSGMDDMADYIQTFIHETGHQLGLDDYYSYESYLEKIDTFAMMSTNSGDQDGFAKMLLGWLPAENIQWVSSSENVVLRPYAETGDIAIIIPEEEKTANGVYSQFIMAEYYKPVKNDIVDEYNRKRRSVSTGEIITLDQPEEGIRLYHIYGRLNDKGDAFVASNSVDSMIPLITNYWCLDDKYWGFYRNDSELTAYTDPSSDFYINLSNDGALSNTSIVSSGISVSGITKGDGVMSFNVGFTDNAADGPKIKDVTVGTDESYHKNYVKLTFDQPVLFNDDVAPAVYDVDPATGDIIKSEKWGGAAKLCRDYRYEYSKSSSTLYVTLSDLRLTDGMLVIPNGCIYSMDNVLAGELKVPVSFIPEDVPSLSVNVASGTYDKGFELQIGGAPEGTVITYTLDGSEPAFGSAVYSAPIKIDESTVVKATAFYSQDGSLYPVSKRLRAAYFIEYANFNRSELTLCEGEYFKLDITQNQNYKIESSDATCVYAANDGENDGWLVAMGKGEAVITITTENGIKSECKVTVDNEPAKEVIAALMEVYGSYYTQMISELSFVIGGKMTLAEFAAGGYLNKLWSPGTQERVVYNGKAQKPEALVFNGVVLLEKEVDYRLGYSNNKNAGKGKIKVTFRNEYKKQAPIEVEFDILPAKLDTDLYFYSECLSHNGKPQKVKPYLTWADSGQSLKIKASDFDVKYYNEMGREVAKLTDEGVYEAVITAKGSNYSGKTINTVKVQKKDVVEKLKVKKKTKSFKATGKEIIPQYGVDYTIQLPKGKGYDDILVNGQLDPAEFEVECYNNVEPGKMVMIITATETGNYSGTQVVTFKIKK